MTRPSILLATLLLVPGWAPPVMAEAPVKRPSSEMRVSGFTYHPEDALIVLPIQGAVPDWRLYLEPHVRVAYVEVPMKASAVFTRRTQSKNLSGGLAQRVLVANNRPGVVRIAVRGREAIRLYPEVVRLDGDRSLLKLYILPYGQKAPVAKPAIVSPTPRPTPVPSPVPTPQPTPQPTPVPSPSPTPEPIPAEVTHEESEVIRLPEPQPTPVLPAATPAPVAIAPEGPEPLSRVEVSRLTLDVSEDYAWGGSNNVKIPGVTGLQGTWSHRWGEAWASRLQVARWEPYTIRDIDMVNSSHVRTETWARLTADWETRVLGIPLTVGGGGTVRAVSNQNTVEPLAPLYLFSKQQLYVAPVAEARSLLPIWGPLRLVLGVEARPLVLPLFDSDVDSAEILLGAGAEGGLELAWRMLALRATYRMETLRSPDFTSFGQDIAGWNVGLAIRY